MNTTETVMDILKTLSDEETINLTDSLAADLHLDSLAMVMLLVCLEDTLQIQLKEADMNPYDLQTVEDVVMLAKRYEGG